MSAYDIRAGTRIILRTLSANHPSPLQAPLIVGISGPVASGKTRLAHILIRSLRKAFDVPVVHVPFDYWINVDGLRAPTYAERFYLDDFSQAFESMSRGEFWMCPRSDLNAWGQSPEMEWQESTEKVWMGRRFKKRNFSATESTGDTDDLYVEVASQRVFSLSPGVTKAIYVVDGTLIFHPEYVRSLYDVSVYCSSKWANRIARMIRRYRRKEVFGQTSSNMAEYVGFLVREVNSVPTMRSPASSTTV